MDSHLNANSQNFKEVNEKKIIIPHRIHEINNKLSTTEKKENFHKIEYNNQNSFKNNKNTSNIKSVTKNLFNVNLSPNQSTCSKSNQIKYEDEFEEKKKIKNTNIYIGLSRKNILDTNKNEKDNNINNNNQNEKILFRYSNRKSNSINADTSININNYKNSDTSINESIIKKDKDKKEYMEKQPPKNIYKKYENYKRIKEEKEIEKVKDYNTNITNKRYKKIINSNINNHNNRGKENTNMQKNENNKNNDIQIDVNKNNIRFNNQNSNRKGNISNISLASQNSNRKANISNISLASQNRTNQNISLMNKRKHIPVSINEKYNITLKNNNKNNYINNNIDINQQNKMEFTKIKFGESVFHSSQQSSQNLLSQSKNNLTQSVKNILPNNDKDNIKDKEINTEKYYNKNIRKVRNNNPEQNKEKLISYRSCILQSEINQDSQDNNINNNNNKDKGQKFIIIEKHKINVEQNKNKEIKADKQIMGKRAYIYKIEEEKNNKDNKSTNQNSYFNTNILKSKGGKNMNINNKIDNNINSNKLNKEYKGKKQTNIIYIKQDKHINKFQRSNHKYHEIKSTSSDRIVKAEDNDEINENNNEEHNKELFRYKINKKPPSILNSTSMDDIRGRRRKKHIENEIKDKDENE